MIIDTPTACGADFVAYESYQSVMSRTDFVDYESQE